MKRSLRQLGTVLAMLCLPALPTTGRAAVPATPSVEVVYLLGYIASSGCAFYRNGIAYDSNQAANHLREKYAALDAVGKVPTAEDFIARVASRSSLTGRNYDVHCAGEQRLWVAPWLRDALAHFRINGSPRN